MGTINPYQVLGISRASSKDEARAQFRKLSKLYHPDNSKTGDPDKFMQVKEAWDLLDSDVFIYSEEFTLWTHKTLFSFEKRR